MVIFSDATQLIGKKLPMDDELADAFRHSTVENDVSNLDARGERHRAPLASKLLETYVPVYVDPGQNSGPPLAVIEVYQDYSSIQTQVDHFRRAVFLVLSIALALLWLLLLPVIHRISARLMRQNRELREADAKHRAVVEHIPAITYTDVVDDEMNTSYISPQVEELLGITPEEWCSDPDLWYRHLHEDDRERTRDAYLRAATPASRSPRSTA